MEISNNTTFNVPWPTTNGTISNTTNNMNSSAETYSVSTHTPSTMPTEILAPTTKPSDDDQIVNGDIRD